MGKAREHAGAAAGGAEHTAKAIALPPPRLASRAPYTPPVLERPGAWSAPTLEPSVPIVL